MRLRWLLRARARERFWERGWRATARRWSGLLGTASWTWRRRRSRFARTPSGDKRASPDSPRRTWLARPPRARRFCWRTVTWCVSLHGARVRHAYRVAPQLGRPVVLVRVALNKVGERDIAVRRPLLALSVLDSWSVSAGNGAPLCVPHGPGAAGGLRDGADGV